MEENNSKKPIGLIIGVIISVIINVILICVIIALLMHNYNITGNEEIKDDSDLNAIVFEDENETVEVNESNSEETNDNSINKISNDDRDITYEIKESDFNVQENLSVSINKIDPNKNLVYIDKIAKTQDYIFDNETTINVPQVNINSNTIKDLNKTLVENAKKTYEYKNQYFINGDVLSLVITDLDPGDGHVTYVYNIEITTGNILTNEELLYKIEENKEDLNDKIYDTIRTEITKITPNGYQEYINQSVRMNNLDGNQINMPLFLNEKGKLCTVVRSFVPIGGDSAKDRIVEIVY